MSITITGTQPEDAVSYATINAMTTGLIRTALEQSRNDIVEISIRTAQGVQSLLAIYNEMFVNKFISGMDIAKLNELAAQIQPLEDLKDTCHMLANLENLPGNLFQGEEYREYAEGELLTSEAFVNVVMDSKSFMGIDSAYPVDVSQYNDAFTQLDTQIQEFSNRFPEDDEERLTQVMGYIKAEVEQHENSEALSTLIHTYMLAMQALIVHRRLLNMYGFFYLQAITLRKKIIQCAKKST